MLWSILARYIQAFEACVRLYLIDRTRIEFTELRTFQDKRTGEEVRVSEAWKIY